MAEFNPLHPYSSARYCEDCASREERPVNCLSTPAVEEVFARLTTGPWARLQRVELPSPQGPQTKWLSTYGGGERAARVSVSFMAAMELQGKLPHLQRRIARLPVSAIVWRHEQRGEAGLCRPIPHAQELSHTAEAWDKPGYFEGWVRGWQVEAVTAEFQYLNESRIFCMRTAANWFSAADGTLLSEAGPSDAPFTGPTLCPHRLGPSGPCLTPRREEGFHVGEAVFAVPSLADAGSRIRSAPEPSTGFYSEVPARWTADRHGMQQVVLDETSAEVARSLEGYFAAKARARLDDEYVSASEEEARDEEEVMMIESTESDSSDEHAGTGLSGRLGLQPLPPQI